MRKYFGALLAVVVIGILGAPQAHAGATTGGEDSFQERIGNLDRSLVALLFRFIEDRGGKGCSTKT